MERRLTIAYLCFASVLLCNVGCTVDNGGASTPEVDDAKTTSRLSGKSQYDSSHSSNELPPARTSSTEELRLLAREALDACGGDDILSRLQRGRLTMNVTGNLAPGMSGDFEVVDTFDGPHKFRREVTGTIVEEPIHMTFVINGNDTWTKIPGAAARRVPSAVEGHDNILLGSFKILKSICDGEHVLEAEPEDPGSTSISVLVTADEGTQSRITFHKAKKFVTGALKSGYDPYTNSNFSASTVYSEHKVTDGITIPTRIRGFRGGDLIVDMKIRELDLLDTVDAALFDKPEQE